MTYNEINPVLSRVSSVLSVGSVLISLVFVLLASFRIHGSLVPSRRYAFIGVGGAGLRLIALPPVDLPWVASSTAPTAVGQTLLVLAYVLLVTAVAGLVRHTAKRVSIWLPHMLTLGCGLAMWLLIALAAFGPLPAVHTVMTDRDVFAMWLVAADVLLTALVATVSLGSLRFNNGAVSLPWMWIAYGMAVAAMGDSVQPLLKVDEAAMFTGLFWGLAYLLTAIGFSSLRDSVVWNDRRDVRAEPLLSYERQFEEGGSRFWERLGEPASDSIPHQ